MKATARIAFAASGLLLLAFVVNVVLGKSDSALVGSASEMLFLFAASACFGVGTLIREALTAKPR